MAGIPVLVQQGLNAEATAARLGCTVGTLKVCCSQHQISLRVPKSQVVPLVPLVPAPQPPKPLKQKRSMPLPCQPHRNPAELPCPGCVSGGSHRCERSPTCQ
jgi:hypothetical protein